MLRVSVSGLGVRTSSAIPFRGESSEGSGEGGSIGKAFHAREVQTKRGT